MQLMSKYILFNIKSQQSFDDIESWVNMLKEKSSPDIKIFLIGNKSDLEEERVISKEQGEKMKNDYGFDLFMETSAKTGFNAQKLFVEAGKILYEEYNDINSLTKESEIFECTMTLDSLDTTFNENNRENNYCCKI